VAFLLGLFAVAVTPREEEPQINVTMANVFIPFPGAYVLDVEALVSTPAEQVLSQIEGIEHVYSVSRAGMAILTVQFKVGVPRIDAIVRLRDTMSANRDWAPPELGILEPVIKPRGIDDVPVVSLTLWSDDAGHGAYELERVAHAIEVEIKRVAGTREVQTLGGPGRVVRVLLDADRLASHGVTALDVRNALQLSNVTAPTGKLVRGNREIAVETGNYLESAADVRSLVVGVQARSPVYLADVAEVVDGPDQPTRYVWTGAGPASAGKGLAAAATTPPSPAGPKKPARTRSTSPGASRSASTSSRARSSPRTCTRPSPQLRRHGQRQAQSLIKKLIFATLSVVVLVFATPAAARRSSSASPWCSRSPRRCSPPGPGASRSTACRLFALIFSSASRRRRDRGGGEHPPPPRHEGGRSRASFRRRGRWWAPTILAPARDRGSPARRSSPD